MLIFGLIISFIGLASSIYGIVKNNDVEAQLESIFETGKTNPGTLFIVVGSLLIAVGIVLIVLYYHRNPHASFGLSDPNLRTSRTLWDRFSSLDLFILLGGLPLMVCGGSLLALGIVSIVHGKLKNDEWEKYYNLFLGKGPARIGPFFIILGVIVVLLGFVLIIIGIRRKLEERHLSAWLETHRVSPKESEQKSK